MQTAGTKRSAYDILGVSPTDSKETIRKRWKELAKLSHPRKMDDSDEASKEINVAYESIMDGTATYTTTHTTTTSSSSSSTTTNVNMDNLFANFFGKPSAKSAAGVAFPLRNYPPNNTNACDTNLAVVLTPAQLRGEASVRVSWMRRTLCKNCFFRAPPRACGTCFGRNNPQNAPCMDCDGRGVRHLADCKECKNTCVIYVQQREVITTTSDVFSSLRFHTLGHESFINGTLIHHDAVISCIPPDDNGWIYNHESKRVTKKITVSLRSLLVNDLLVITTLSGAKYEFCPKLVMEHVYAVPSGYPNLDADLTLIVQMPRRGDYDPALIAQAFAVKGNRPK
jgi:DnaJ-class molecular chaperone